VTRLEVLFTPAEFSALAQRDLSGTACVVFDVLRATSSIVTALGSGAEAIVPVAEIGEALALRNQDPAILLAGEREGVRIRSELTGSIDFDFGNSPREFTQERVRGKRIAMTTTNGTRAIRACAHARTVVLCSFLNLRPTAEFIEAQPESDLLVICSGTFEQAAYEDVLGAGALCDLIWPIHQLGAVADSAQMAHRLFRLENPDLVGAVSQSRNGRRLLAQADLREDVAFCLRQDVVPLVAKFNKDGSVRPV
jgi:2-phosphosulfolactate phosphatase